MMIENNKIKDFKDLNTWKEAHILVLLVYKIINDNFPEIEKFGLSSQGKRAAISISSNITEGFGRRTAKDKQHFYNISETSLAELQNQFIAARDLSYIRNDIFNKFYNQSIKVAQLLAGLARSAQDHF